MKKETGIFNKIIRRRRRKERKRRNNILRMEFDSKAIRRRQDRFYEELKKQIIKPAIQKFENKKLTWFDKIINGVKQLWKTLKII